MAENHPPDPGGTAAEADVLGSHLEFLRKRLGGEQFEVLVRAVQATCALLAEEQQVLLGGPQEGNLSPDLRGEYLSLLAVMITGHLDHHLVEFSTLKGAKGWAVVENAPTQHPGAPPPTRDATQHARDATQHARIDGRLDDITHTTDSPAP